MTKCNSQHLFLRVGPCLLVFSEISIVFLFYLSMSRLANLVDGMFHIPVDSAPELLLQQLNLPRIPSIF